MTIANTYKHVVQYSKSLFTPQVTESVQILADRMALAARDACVKNNIDVSLSNLKKQLRDTQHESTREALLHLSNKANIIAKQTSHIIGMLLREDPMFAKINREARDTVHLLMHFQKKFIKETLPLYEKYKQEFVKTHDERKSTPVMTTLIDSKIEDIQDKIKADLAKMKELYTKGQYQAKIVYGLEQTCLNISSLSDNEKEILSSTDLFTSLDKVHKAIGSYIEKNSTYTNNMIEIKP